MNILIIANKFPYPPKDGGVIAKLNMIKGLHHLGANITVAAINTSKHYFDKKQLPSNIAQLANFHDCYVNTDIKPFDAAKNLLFSKLPYNAERFINKDFEKLLIKLLKENTFDIVQLEVHYVCPYIPLIRKYSNAKISYRSHNIEHEIWQRTANNTTLLPKKWYLNILAKRIKNMEMSYINKYDFLVPITKKDADQYQTYGNTKPTHVCPTGIDDSDIEKTATNFSYLSLFHLGGLDWAPNQQGIVWFLENCWNNILAQFPEVTFKIGGRNAPNWLIEKCNSYKNVEFLGEVPDAKTFYKENAIMVVPLLAGSGMRIKIIEGLALGKAIVSTSIGAEGIDATDQKEILIANTADEFTDKIGNILKNKDGIKGIGENAINFVQRNFNNNTIIAKLLAFYEHNITHN